MVKEAEAGIHSSEEAAEMVGSPWWALNLFELGQGVYNLHASGSLWVPVPLSGVDHGALTNARQSPMDRPGNCRIRPPRDGHQAPSGRHRSDRSREQRDCCNGQVRL